MSPALDVEQLHDLGRVLLAARVIARACRHHIGQAQGLAGADQLVRPVERDDRRRRGVVLLGDLLEHVAIAQEARAWPGPRASSGRDRRTGRRPARASSWTMIVDGRFCCSSAARVALSSLPVTGIPRASWKPLTALSSDMPFLPSMTPGEKPAASSSTWAWKAVPSIGEPLVPGATHEPLLALDGAGLAADWLGWFWATAAVAAIAAIAAVRRKWLRNFFSLVWMNSSRVKRGSAETFPRKAGAIRWARPGPASGRPSNRPCRVGARPRTGSDPPRA